MEQMCVVNHWEVCVVNDRVTLVVTNWTAVLDFLTVRFQVVPVTTKLPKRRVPSPIEKAGTPPLAAGRSFMILLQCEMILLRFDCSVLRNPVVKRTRGDVRGDPCCKGDNNEEGE